MQTRPKTVEQLHALCRELQTALLEKEKVVAEKQATIDTLQEQLTLLCSKRYQRQSEEPVDQLLGYSITYHNSWAFERHRTNQHNNVGLKVYYQINGDELMKFMGLPRILY